MTQPKLKQILNHAFYLKEHSVTSEYLIFLEESFFKLKNSSEDPWEIAKLIAEHSLENARVYLKNKLLPSFFSELNRAWKVLHPLRPKWEFKIDWQVLRLEVFTHLADYYRRIKDVKNECEMWEKVLKLEKILPKQLISRNRKQITELSYAIVLTKNGDLEKAELYTKRAIQALERELRINKSIKIEDNICPSNDAKDVARFKIRMQSLCLAYHHLGSIKKSFGQNKKALELFSLSNAIGKKFLKDKKLKKVIQKDTEKALPKPSPLFSKRTPVGLEKIAKPIDDKELLNDVFGKNKVKKLKEVRRAESLSSFKGNLNDSLYSIGMNIKEETFVGKPAKKDAQEEPINKLRVVNDLTQLRKLENQAAVTIQKAYRGFKDRNKAKLLIKGFINSVENKDSDSSQLDLRRPTIIFTHEDSVSEMPSAKMPSEVTEEKLNIISESESSEPDILVKGKSALSKDRKSKPSLFDYLNLHYPDLYISQSIKGKVYSWRITLVRKKIIEGNIECFFGIFGSYEKFTDTLVYMQSLLIDTNRYDERFLCPFKFETIWPIVEYEMTKDELDDEIEDTEPNDESAFTTIKDIANFILSRSGIQNILNGSRLVEETPVSVYSDTPKDFQPVPHLLSTDGVAKVMTQYAAHERVKKTNNLDNFKQLEQQLIGKIIEKGISKIEENYLMVVLKIVKSVRKSRFLSSLQICTTSCKSNWFDELTLTWEETTEYFSREGYKIDVYYIFCTQKMKSKARDVFFESFPHNFYINKSRLNLSLNLKKDEIESDLFYSDSYSKNECHEEWEANFDQLASNYDNEVGNICLGIFQKIQLAGDFDQFHLKFTGINKNILIEGKRRLDDWKFVQLVSDYSVVKRISKIFEMGEIVKSILQYEISIRRGFCGKVLAFGRSTKSLTHSTIRTIDNIKYQVTVVVGDRILICLYNLYTSWQLVTSFSLEDLKHYFSNLRFEEFAAICYEETFVKPLLEGFTLLKGMLGNFVAWKLPQRLEESLKNEKKIQAFQFTIKKYDGLQMIITTKTLFERKLSKVLMLPNSYLTETIHEEEVLLQRTKVVCGCYSLVTLTKLNLLEEWRIYIHFFSSSREFFCKIYNSDMFNLCNSVFDKIYHDPNHVVNRAATENKIWEIILAECTFEHHYSLDFVFKFNTIVTPMRELLYSNHIFFSSFVYFEVYMKSSVKFHLKFPLISSIKDTEFILVTIRSYNYNRKLWEKKSLKLKELLLELLNAGIVTESILLNTLINYSDLKYFAGCSCRILKVKNSENTVRVKLLPDLEFSESEPEELFDDRSLDVKSTSSVLDQDFLLYQTVYFRKSPLIVGIFYNEFAEEFAFKAYKPFKGVTFRVPISKKQVFRKISFSVTLVREKAYFQLGKKIFEGLLDRLLKVV